MLAAMHGWISRSVMRATVVSLLATALFFSAVGSDTAFAVGPPDVDVVLVIEVSDTASWLALQDEVLRSAADSGKALVSVAAPSGGQRSITIIKPKFATEIYLHSGVKSLKVVLTGKVVAGEALANLTNFERAVLRIQAGMEDNHLTLNYGLTGVYAQLLEMYLSRP